MENALVPLQAGEEGMSEDELVTYLREHESRAIGYYNSDIASEQADAIDRYYRRPYGDEKTGRSKVVDATVAITVDNALAACLKPFVSQDDTVAFGPRQAEDEEQAKQATEYVNYVLHNDNPGFIILHDWFKDAFLSKLGVVKAWWEDKSRDTVVRLEGLDPMQVEALLPEAVDGPWGPDEDGLFALDIINHYQDGCIKICNVPPEEHRISPYARPGQVPPYEAHVRRVARSELVEMGFDPDMVDSLPAYASSSMEDERDSARYQDENLGSSRVDVPGDKSRDQIEVCEEYVLIDFDGDGVSELRKVLRSGDVVLFNEETDCSPFARLCPVPMPHKIYGQSLADQVIDEQRIRTVLWRQTLDNLYLANNPKIVVPKRAERPDGSTYEDLQDDSPGGIIRTEVEGIEQFGVPFVADKSFPMLDYVGQQAQMRTGIMLQGQGMDPDAIDKAGQMTATQAAIMEDGRNARAELIARIFAETGIKDLFRILLKLLVKHQPRERLIRLRNKWVPMDPRSWNTEMDLSISVGLGSGNRGEQIAVANSILETMDRLAQTPFADLIDKENVYNAVKRQFSAAGIKNIDDFLREPERDEEGNVAQNEGPDPEQMKMQAEMQLQQAKMQADQQAAAAKLETERAIAQIHAQLERDKAEFEANLAREKALAEFELAERKMQLEAQLKREEMDHKAHMDANLRDNRPGGDLDK